MAQIGLIFVFVTGQAGAGVEDSKLTNPSQSWILDTAIFSN